MTLDLLKRSETSAPLTQVQHDANFTAIENELNAPAGWNGTNTAARPLADLRKDWITLSDYTGSATPGECHTALLNAIQGTEHRHVVLNRGDWTFNAQTTAQLGRDKIVHCEGAKFTYSGANTDFGLRIITNGWDLAWEGGEIDGANKSAQPLLIQGRSADMTSGLSVVRVEGLVSRNAFINSSIGQLSANLFVYGGFEQVSLRNLRLLGSGRASGAASPGNFGCNGYCSSINGAGYVRKTIIDGLEVRDCTFPEAAGSGNDFDADGISVHCPPDLTDTVAIVKNITGQNISGRMFKSQCSQNEVDGWYYRHPSSATGALKGGGIEVLNLQYGGGTIKNGRVVLEGLGSGNSDCAAVVSGVSGSTGTLGIDTFVDGLNFYNGSASKCNAPLVMFDSMDLPRLFRVSGLSMIGSVGVGLYLGSTSNASTRPLVLYAEGWKGNFTGITTNPAKMVASQSGVATYATVHAQSCFHTGGSSVPVAGNVDGSTSNANATVTASGCRNLTASWG